MKPIYLAALLFPTFALAQTPPFTPQQQKACTIEAQAFQFAASYRDSGLSPQQTLSAMSATKDVPQKALKGLINTVYFDSNFQGAGGEPLFNQVYQACLYPNGRFQPLN
jgi:hypothetical protein